MHRTAHQLGMRTTATMMFGVGETFDQRVNHFEVVRRLQEETGGFTAFIPWSFQPKHTALGGRGWDEATSVEYLKVLAIARLYLDNIENVQASWVTQGLKVLEVGLHFGGNDVGSVMLEENVVKAAGTTNRTTEEELRQNHPRCRVQTGAAGHALSDDVLELGRMGDQAHVWQQTHGKPPRRCYHDRQGSAKMKEPGLQPSDTAAPGGKETGQNITHYIIPG